MAAITNSKLLQTTGMLDAQDACVVIVKTEWNAIIVDALEEGCEKTLAQGGVRDIRLIEVPCAFEIPFAIKSYWDVHKYKDDRPHAFIALGCVLRGGTPHFEYVCRAVTDGVLQLNLSLPVPTVFGILTVDNQQQAEERIGGTHGHKGEEAAITALKMIALIKSFQVPAK
jgi:6,7-dimethyl-8-ribityllumazine synthase